MSFNFSTAGHIVFGDGAADQLRDEVKKFGERAFVITGNHTNAEESPLKELCEQSPKPDLAVAIGPPVMMKFCSLTTKPYAVPTVVSLNTIMIDGTGMCGGCRVTVGGQTKFVCVDGPEFDGHLVEFDQMIQRLGSYREQEKLAAAGCNLHAEAVKKGLQE